jgi:hypothetical protein
MWLIVKKVISIKIVEILILTRRYFIKTKKILNLHYFQISLECFLNKHNIRYIYHCLSVVNFISFLLLFFFFFLSILKFLLNIVVHQTRIKMD